MVMKQEFFFEYQQLDCLEELTFDDQALVVKAMGVLSNSYSPYSGFKVGCSLRMANGEIIVASNQENAAFPSGLCAERVALFSAKSAFPDVEVETVVICASKNGDILDQPITPCGGCRQVFSETFSRQERSIRLVMYGLKSILIIDDISLLMPFSFDKRVL